MRLTSECAIQKSSSALLTTTAPTVGSPAGPCTHPVQLRKHLSIEQVERRPAMVIVATRPVRSTRSN